MPVTSISLRRSRPVLGGVVGGIAFCAAFLVSPSALSGQAGNADPDRLTLQRSLFSLYKYSFREAQDAKVYEGLGLRFSDGFEAVLAERPDAMAEASRARPWQVVQFAGTMGVLAGGAMQLIEAVQDASDLSDGTFPESSWGSNGLYVAAASLIVAVVGGAMSQRHLKNGVALFNRGAGSGETHPLSREDLGGRASEATLRGRFGVLPIQGAPAMEFGLELNW